MAAVRPAGPEPRITTLAWLLPSPPGAVPLLVGLLTAVAISSPSTIASVGKLKGDLSIGSIVAVLHTPGEYQPSGLGSPRPAICGMTSLPISSSLAMSHTPLTDTMVCCAPASAKPTRRSTNWAGVIEPDLPSTEIETDDRLLRSMVE